MITLLWQEMMLELSRIPTLRGGRESQELYGLGLNELLGLPETDLSVDCTDNYTIRNAIRRMRQLITAASAQTHPSPDIHACKWRSARVPRSVCPEPLSPTRRRDWLQSIGAW